MQIMSNGYNIIADGDSALYYATVKYNNTTLDIILNNFKYVGMTQSDSDLTIGATCSATVSFSVYNPSVSLTNKEIVIYEGIMVNGSLESVKMGLFTIQKPTIKDGLAEYTGYDRMAIKTTKVFSSNLTYPANTKAIMSEIATNTGLTFDTVLPTTISIATKPAGYTYREMIGYIAALHGKNAIINRNGHLEFKWYTSTSYSVSASKYYENGLTLNDEENYILGKISCTVKGTNSTETLTSGTSGHGISIENPFMTQTILDSIFSSIGNFTYRSLSIRFLGDFRIDLGDIISVTSDGVTYSVPVMQITHEWDGGAITEVTSIGKTDTESEMDASGPSTKAMDRYYGELVLMNQAIINKLDVDVANITYATILNLNAAVGRIDELETNSITSEYANLHYANIDFANVESASIGTMLANVGLISSATITEGHVTGYLSSVKINADIIDAGTLSVDRLLIKGANSIVYEINAECSGLSTTELSKDVYKNYLNGTDIVANSITANQIAASTITAEQIASNTITAVQIDSSVLSTSVFEAAFSNLNGNINNEVYESTAIPTLSNYPITIWGDLQPRTGLRPNTGLHPTRTSETIDKHLGAYVNVNNTNVYRLRKNGSTYAWDDVTNTPEGYTIRGYNNNVAQLSLKVNSATLKSELNACAEEVRIKGDIIDLTGAVSINDNVKINTDGTLEAINGKFSGVINATNGSFTGKITSTIGTIGGWAIATRYLQGDYSSYRAYIQVPHASTDYVFSVQNKSSTGYTIKWGVMADGSMYSSQKTTCGELKCIGTGTFRGELECIGTGTFRDGLNIYNRSTFNSAAHFMGTVYNQSGGPVFLSDENAKSDITPLGEQSADFIYSLNPVSYKFKDNDSNRFHHGLIAQSVKESMGEEDWGLYIDQKYSMDNPTLDDDGNVLNEDGTINPTKGLRYDELIADLIATVQSQNNRIIALETKLQGQA